MADQDAPAKQSNPDALAPSKASGSDAPVTDDIDSEWPSEAQAAPSSSATESKAPRTEEVDSGWLGDGAEAEPRAAAGGLAKPNFPRDPEVPTDVGRVGSPAPQSAELPSQAPPSDAPAKGKSSAPAASASATETPRPSSRSKVADIPEERRAARYSQPVAPTHKGGSRWIGLLLLALGVGVIGVVKFAGREGAEAQAEKPASGATSDVQAASPHEVAATPPKAPAEPAPAAPLPAAAPEPSAASASSDVAAAAPAPGESVASAPEAAPSAAAPAASAEPPSTAADGKKRVVIDVMPPQARVYYKGKDQGKPPVTIELEPGKRRSFEVAAPGFGTRKVVVDGSKPEITVGLRPVAASADAPAAP